MTPTPCPIQCHGCDDRGWVDDGHGYKIRCDCLAGTLWASTTEGQMAAMSIAIRKLGTPARELAERWSRALSKIGRR